MKSSNLYRFTRYMAIVLGFFAILFFLTIVESSALFALIFDKKWGVLPIALMISIPIIGFFMSLTKSKLGGLVMIAGSLILMAYLLIIGGGGNGRMAFVYAMPFMIPGILFVLTTRIKNA